MYDAWGKDLLSGRVLLVAEADSQETLQDQADYMASKAVIQPERIAYVVCSPLEEIPDES